MARVISVSLSFLAVFTVALAALIYTNNSTTSQVLVPLPQVPSLVQPAAPPSFGSNVIVLDPTMSLTDIQTTVNNIASQQLGNQFGTARYTLLFKPGTYGTLANPLIFQVGYYTEVAGLGASPNDVVINGQINVFNQCDNGSCIALNNFWRSLSNLTINVAGGSGCYANTEFWAVSQAAPLRRVNINGGFTLMDYCTGPSYSSGGFMSDSKATANVVNGSQQQFLVRNSNIGGWSNGVWNQVFAGVVGAPAQSFTTTQGINPYTTLATNPVSREKPYLTYDSGTDSYSVFVPDLRTNSSGTSWSGGPTAGTSLPISSFFIANPTDSVNTINAALASGQNLIFTPGIYQLDATIQITNPDTVVLGMGFATLVPNNGIIAMTVGDVAGVKISGLLFDAGPQNSPVLLQVGSTTGHGVSIDPTTIQDVFFRIGGATPGKATTSLLVNTDYTLLDDIWAWRADHGNGVGWTSNTADSGLIVNGANVTATGLFVEHYQKYQVIWNGKNGRTIFFQSEMPYDPPNQAAYTHDGINGYASYKVGEAVQTHEAWGLGSYCFFNVDPTIHAAHGFEVPNTPGVKLHDVLTISLNAGIIDHVVNITGAATPANTVAVNLVLYQSVDSFTLSSSPNFSQLAQTITITATVSPITATGTITFTEGAATLGSASLASGLAVITTTATLPYGNHVISANYSGDANYAAQPIGQPLIQVVCPPQFTVTSVTDDGSGTYCGTLSYVLSQPVAGSNPVTVTFALTSSNTITLTGILTTTAKVKPYVILDGRTSGSGSRIIINGNGVSGDGLHLMGHNILTNLTIKHFRGRELVVEGSENRVQGVVIVSS